MEFTIYCDESRHDGGLCHPFMAIGGLWVEKEYKLTLNRELQALCRAANLNSEVKWNKVSARRLEAYKSIVDFFFNHPSLAFRVIVVEQEKLKFVDGKDRELGFYKFYYLMLRKWIEADNEYTVLLDFQKNREAGRYTTLKRILERACLGKAWIKDLTIIDSSQSRLAQVADLLTGAVAAAYCGKSRDGKAELAAYIAQRAGFKSLVTSSPSPAKCKFNVFKIEPQSP
ncbi:MAG: DUF3800 domain-containing protein [Candidatus Sumerlaeaceae bacterium]|nr:DUF3800 domain-containing protein [Candidatus Sumerlaeaceae bacterium]